MAGNDILDRLRIDPGQRTVGQLLQDREAALYEIGRLQRELDRLKSSQVLEWSDRQMRALSSTRSAESEVLPFRPGTLMRISDVCQMLGIGRSTVYKLLSEKAFPKPVRVGPRSVRWRVELIEAWRDARS